MGRPERVLADAGIIASGGSILIAAFYCMLRIGFGTSRADVLLVIGLALFLINFPVVWSSSRALALGAKSATWISSPGLGLLVAIVVSLIIPSAEGKSRVSGTVIACIGSLLCIYVAVRWYREKLTRSIVRVLAVSLGLALWAAGVLWASGYLSPLLLENLALRGGTGHIDPYFHAALANMARVYQSVSVGLDGTPSFHYHFGSHWTFATWAQLLGLPVVRFYQLGYPVIVAPLFFFMFVVTVQSVRRLWSSGEEGTTPLWHDPLLLGFLIALVGPLPAPAMFSVGVWPTGPLLSESYGFALILCFAAVTLALAAWKSAESMFGERSALVSFIERFLLIAGAPILIAAIGFVKISVAAMLAVAALYLVIRLPRLHRPAVYGALLTSAIAMVWTFATVALREEGSFAPFTFLRFHLAPAWWPFFFTLHFVWSWIYIVLRFNGQGIRSFGDVKAALRQRSIVDVEVVAVFACVGALPGIFLDIGSDSFYFSDVQRWIALAALTGCVPLVVRMQSAWDRFRSGGLFGFETRKILWLIVGVPILLSIAFTVLTFDSALVADNLALRRKVQALSGGAAPLALKSSIKRTIKSVLHGQIRESTADLRLQLTSLFGAKSLDRGMRRSPAGQLLVVLQQLDSLPSLEKRRSVLFIPQDYTTFWGLIREPSLCKYVPLVGPGVSGLAMIDGVPPLGCKLSPAYGEMVYRNRTGPQSADAMSSSRLCARARSVGMIRVYALRKPSAGAPAIERIDCGT